MEKRMIFYLAGFALALIIILGGVFLFMWNREKIVHKGTPEQKGTLIVNNKTVVTENIVIHFKKNANYADLPLIEVMKNLGMTVDWIDENTAEIVCEDKNYVINLSKVSLVEFEQNYNLLSPPPGGERSYEILDKELILDSCTMKSALNQMGVKIEVVIDYTEFVVYINTEDTGGDSFGR